MLKKLTKIPDYLFYIAYIKTEYFEDSKSISSYYIDKNEKILAIYTKEVRPNYFYSDKICIYITIDFTVKPLIKKKNLKNKRGKSTDKYFQSFVEDLIKQFNITLIDIKKIGTEYRASFSTKKDIEYMLTAHPKDGRTGSKGFICKFTKTVYTKKFF